MTSYRSLFGPFDAGQSINLARRRLSPAFRRDKRNMRRNERQMGDIGLWLLIHAAGQGDSHTIE